MAKAAVRIWKLNFALQPQVTSERAINYDAVH
jgi:hypothetical protein